MKNKNTWQAERHLADDRASGFYESDERVLDTEDLPNSNDTDEHLSPDIEDDEDWYDYESVD